LTKLRSGLLCAIAVSGLGFPAWAATFTEFDPSESLGTFPTTISGGVIAGYYWANDGDLHGLVRAADGSITPFDAPHAIATYATSINRAGTVTGYYDTSSGVEHGIAPLRPSCIGGGGSCFFVRTVDGAITEFTIPNGGPTNLCLDIYCTISINDSGAIAASYGGDSGTHGFVRSPHGKITTFNPAGSTSTWVTGINRSGMIAGWYNDSSKGTHGFVRAPDGSITTFDVPNSTSTETFSINRAGAIAGYYFDSGNYHAPARRGFHGFVRSPDGTITTFDPPGSIAYLYPVSIADSGVITGTYEDKSGLFHGFIRKKGGKITSFDPPGASYTFSSSIDSDRTDKNVITGYYVDSSGNYHGFIRTP
jgi:hypothetical protein